MALSHELPLLSTIAVGLGLSFVCGLIAAKLRIPPIVGYLLAGIIIGPYTPGINANTEMAEELSEIGIVLLMFGVGLHFSIKDLMVVRHISLPGAVVQIAAATLLGVGLAHLWGWSLAGGLMFGLALSVASTVVLLRSLESYGLLQTTNGRIAIGWLIVEDLVMVLALVLVPALAVAVPDADGGLGQEVAVSVLKPLLLAVGKVVLFAIVMLVAGRKILPWLLTAVTRTRSRELFTLAVFAMAMGVAFGAAKLFGVSFALGAFFAGMMIRESELNRQVADRILPFQEAFAVLFFVAVGMLFNPAILVAQPLDVLAVVAIIMVGKSLAALLIVLMFGYPLKAGLLISSSLAQIGEFSFVLAAMGVAYGVLPVEGRDLILAGALISIALNPLMFRGAHAMYRAVRSQPRLAEIFNVREGDLSALHGSDKQALDNLVVLVGYGRVGRFLLEEIHDLYGLDVVVIDNNRERIEGLRQRGVHAIAGDGAAAETLKEAAIGKARALVVAVPNPFEARRIVETAQALQPSIKILARAMSDEELAYFAEKQVDLALFGPRQIARAMADYLKGMKA